ncbi:MAG: HEPN domain-containing protein [Bacteroidota bacterium]
MEKTTLKTSIAHLPGRFQDDLQAIKELALKYGPKPAMIILFGSFARGSQVEDTTQVDGNTYEYTSDYDILVVTEQNIKMQRHRWLELRNRIDRRPTPIPTSLITHSIHVLNEKIKDRHYFFLDLIKEGIMLYDSGQYELAVPPAKLTSDKRLKKAKRYREHYMEDGDGFFRGCRFFLSEKDYRKAAFLLHQAVESYYTALSLVITDYKPKTHDLAELNQIAIQLNEACRAVFLLQTQEQEDCFTLLRRAYIDARYDLTYTITLEQLQYLMERAVVLRELTEQLCEAEMARLEKQLEA